eukprot:351384-Chlamydomonas_euryale.AAC.1
MRHSADSAPNASTSARAPRRAWPARIERCRFACASRPLKRLSSASYAASHATSARAASSCVTIATSSARCAANGAAMRNAATRPLSTSPTAPGRLPA